MSNNSYDSMTETLEQFKERARKDTYQNWSNEALEVIYNEYDPAMSNVQLKCTYHEYSTPQKAIEEWLNTHLAFKDILVDYEDDYLNNGTPYDEEEIIKESMNEFGNRECVKMLLDNMNTPVALNDYSDVYLLKNDHVLIIE